MKTSFFTIFFLAFAGGAVAQVSLDELDQAVESRNSELESFRDRLNDQDPEKALAALQFLIANGDADQRRMAIRHGLYSTDLAVRATVLRAILDSHPTLVLQIDPLAEEPDVYYFRAIKDPGGSLAPDNSGQVLFKVSGYDEKEECWTYQRGVYTPCFARMRGDIVSIQFADAWGQYTLNSEGALIGQHSIRGNIADVQVDLSE